MSTNGGLPDPFDGRATGLTAKLAPKTWRSNVVAASTRPEKKKAAFAATLFCKRTMGLEPTTPGLGSQCSTN